MILMADLRMLMICSSLNLVLRMMSSPRSVILRENSHYFCTSFQGGGHQPLKVCSECANSLI